MEMGADPFVDLIYFFQSLTQYRHVWQVPVLLGALLLAMAATLLLGGQLKAEGTESADKIRRLKRLMFASILVAALFGLRHHFGLGRPAPLLHMAFALSLALAVTHLGLYVLHHGVGWSKRLVFVQTQFLRLTWLVFALHVTGLLAPAQAWLRALDFTLGGTRISLWQLMQGSVLVTAVVVAALWLGAWFERRLNRTDSLDTHVRVIVVKLVRGLLLFFSLLLSMPLLGIDATFLSVLGGALGVGLGFALQKVASNYVSGFILLMDRSIRMNDVITVEGRQGTVIRLDARCVTLSSTDGLAFIVPNETFLTQTIINHTRMGVGVCHGLTVEVVYDSDLVAVQRLMEAVAREQTRILSSPAPEALVGKMTGHGLEVTLNYWIADPGKGDSGLRSALIQAIRQGLREQGIRVPLKDGAQAVLP